MYPKHTHDHDGQEEVYIVLDGEGEMTLNGETVRMDKDTWIRVGPSVPRHVEPGPGGMRMLVIGGVPGGVYTAPAPTELGGPEEMGEGVVE
ncbi:MAG TPA: cupin domain-containing protein [Gaiellaceae bacterium]|nr:cupin domain-containing protein [Gaiellaceae bacterium]